MAHLSRIYLSALLLLFNGTVLLGQVIPGFSASSYGSCAPSTIYFTNQTMGPFKSFNWSFGNGSGSSFTDPSVVYIQAGTYSVTLTVTDTGGLTSTITKQIRIYRKPTASFTVDRATVCERSPVHFTNRSSQGDTSIQSVLWDLGDGNSSPYQSPSHQYFQQGNYSISLYVTDHFGCTADTTLSNRVQVLDRPTARFYFDETRVCKAPVRINFNNLTNHPNTTYSWSFGDGSQSQAISPSHEYTSFGQYSVRLIATHTDGCSDTSVQAGNIQIAPLQVGLTYDQATLCIGDSIRLSEDIQPKLSTPTSYTWQLPDGSSLNGRSVTIPLHSTTQDITLLVNNQGCSGKLTKTIAAGRLPANTSNISTKKLCGNLSTVQCSMDPSDLDSFSWRIDGKYNRSAKQISEKFNEEGPHYIQLFALGKNGCSASYRDTVYRSNPAILGTMDTGACVPYAFTPVAYLKGKYPQDSLIWDLSEFGKDSRIVGAAPDIYVSDTGYAYLYFTLVDSIGCRIGGSWQIGGGKPPTAAFSQSVDSICILEDIHFRNSSTKPNLPTDFYWKLGALEGEGKEWSPQVRLTPGDYDLTHIASHYGCTDTILQEHAVHLKGPYADFHISTDSCISSFKTVYGLILEADSFQYQLNDTYFGSDTLFSYSFRDGDKLKVLAVNHATGCVDSTQRYIGVQGDGILDWEVMADNCAPADITIRRRDQHLDSIKWYVNDIEQRHQEEVLRTSLNSGGQINIKLQGFAGSGCDLTLDTTLYIQGPSVKGLVQRSFGCLPKTFSLIDSLWSDSNRRYWVIDGDTIAAKGIVTPYVLRGLKDPMNRVLQVVLVAEEGECHARRQFNYTIPGLPFESAYTDQIIDCNLSRYTFEVSTPFKGQVSEYVLTYNGQEIKNNTGILSLVLDLDGSTDTVYLSIIDTAGCRSTQKLVIQKARPTLEVSFSSTQSVANCPPLFVEFSDDSKSRLGKITERSWRINGQFFSELQKPVRLFSLPGAFSISLRVTDERGCTDSVFLDSFVQINGTVVDVDFGAADLCLGASLFCTVKEGAGVNYEWDMGDGSVLQGDSLTYTYATAGRHQVVLLVSDSSGCKYPLSNADSTRIHALPVANLGSVHPCANSRMQLVDLTASEAPVEFRRWTIDGMLQANSSDTLDHLTAGSDLYVKLWVSDRNGCVDSTEEAVRVFAMHPELSLSKPFYCVYDSIHVRSMVEADTSILLYTYQLDGQLLGTEAHPGFMVSEGGEHSLILYVQDAMGCLDSSLPLPILVADSGTRSIVQIEYATFIEDNAINVVHTKATPDYFGRYRLFDEQGRTIATNSKRDFINFMIPTSGDDRQQHCFKLGVDNGCYALDPDSLPMHCTVHVQGEPTVRSRTLKWTPYVGWPVKSYTVQRLDGSSWRSLATVPNDVFSYVDQDLENCSSPEIYRVVASANNRYFSISDTAHILPLVDYELETPVFENIAVLGDQQIELLIDSSINAAYRTDHYSIQKTFMEETSGLSAQLARIRDGEVQTQTGPYTYRVRQVDHCLVKSEWSLPARSIHLSVENDVSSSYPRLRWNRNLLWHGDFSHYSIHRMAGNTEVEVARIYEPNDTTYVDRSGDLACAQNTCYRVIAHADRGQWQSPSNRNCAGTYSTLFVPNAVTPNGDLLNDRFQPVGMYISHYTLSIYSRWGELIHQTQTCMEGWDCTVDGQQAPNGTYFYTLSAIGADGKIHNLSGTVHLLR